MQSDKKIFRNVKSKNPKRVVTIVLLVSIFGLAGIVGTISTYRHQNNSNYKVNISGRQRFLSTMILLDLQKLENDKNNTELVELINQRRILFHEGMSILKINRPQQIEGLRNSKFANENTPESIDIYSESMSYYMITAPDTEKLGAMLPMIREKLRQTIGASWDTYTGNLALHYDQISFRLMLFVVVCFSMVVALTGYAIAIIVSVDRENKVHKHILKSSSKFVSLGEHAVNINHDMNNILSIITTFMAVIKTSIEDKPDLLKKFAVLEKSINRLTALTSAMRRSIIGDTNNDEPETFRIIEIVEDCETILRDKLSSSAVTFHVDVRDDLTITMRKDFLYQLLLNLISNSIEAVATSENPWVKVQVEEEADNLKIKVIDSGNGLSPEVKEKLFTPFFTTKSTGSGLGLNYLRRMAEEVNGQLFYDDSSANTSFVFRWRRSH